ncbi:hypothetical protein QL093DRAFT_2070685 [Fusarium oxysporum]|nr:hypothetical protein QL093DRAFT_2070685 [Fusarium oxysporum]
MASVERGDEPRKKWTRAKAPRVRTGCITWCVRNLPTELEFSVTSVFNRKADPVTASQIRHLKCDEGKPSCQRCLKDERKCDGYQQLLPLVQRFKKPRRCVQHKAKRKDATILVTPRPPPSIYNFTCPADRAHFHHARECTIGGFGVDSYPKFWYKFVLPFAHMVEPVKYALCALGGAHRRFITGHEDGPTSSSALDFELISIQQYNQAILHLKPLMSDSSRANLQTTLICCVIFICIENMHGRYTDSIRHLRAGGQLLNSLREQGLLTCSPSSGSSLDGTSESECCLFHLTTDMLYQLGQNVAIYTGNDVLLKLGLRPRQADMGDPRMPFSSFEEADSLLELVADRCSDFVICPRPKVWPDVQPDDTLQDSFTTPPACFNPSRSKQTFSASRTTFAVWNSRFELTKKDKKFARLSPEDKRALGYLNMYQSTWSALVKLETAEDEFSRKDGEEILQCADNLIRKEQARTPIFAFNGYLILTLFVVAGSCRDYDIQSRSISMLRSLRRREGTWDSQEVADFYEIMLAATADDIANC